MKPDIKPPVPCYCLLPAAPSRLRLPILLAVIVILTAYRVVLKARDPPQPADVCHVIGFNPSAEDLWQFSTRSVCLSANLCLNTSNPTATVYHSSDLSATKCSVGNVDFSPTNISFPVLLNDTLRSCPDFQRELVYCAHGPGLNRNNLTCPLVQPVPPRLQEMATWHEDISILVPNYAYPLNIYHYANPLADLARTVEQLPTLMRSWGLLNVRAAKKPGFFSARRIRPRKINILFQTSRSVPLSHPWKHQLLQLIIRQRIQNLGLDVALHYLQEPTIKAPLTCLRNAVVLGRRGHLDVWPFPNATDVPLDGLSVPEDAVTFKKAVYDSFGINARLPSLGDVRKGTAVSELPPFTVAYARRDGRPGSDGYFRSGAMRRLTEADEEWFMAMLRNETSKAGAKLIVISARATQSLETQVKAIVHAGFVVGIHGANLVNALFMHPFGVLMEILPKYVTERCYVAGANSGLKYLRFESSEQAGVVESGCHPMDAFCEIDPRQRLVKLGRQKDRESVRDMVREGIEHLQWIRERFPEAVSVSYNDKTLYYEVRG